jgi:hypothetical protein
MERVRQLSILTLYLLYTQESILYANECDYAVNKQVHAYNTRYNDGYHSYIHNLELYDSKPTVAGCIFCGILPYNIKQIGNNNQFQKELKDVLIK